jgi:urea transport system permease protein
MVFSQLDRRATFAAYAIFLVLVAAAPLVLDGFWLNRLAKYLVYGMLGIAIAMCWGYAGILNLGQGLFFGLGAYMLAMSLKMASPASLQHGGNGPVPDFMLSNAEPGAVVDLCCINQGSFLWLPFRYQWFGILMGVVLPVVVAFVLGAVVFRKRIAGVFVSIITLALVLLVRLLLVDAQPLTNGFNGLSDLAWLRGGARGLDPKGTATY